MTTLSCSWIDPPCTHVASSTYHLYRHTVTDHWPWQLSRYVCIFCERGWHEKGPFEAHKKSEMHKLTRQMMILREHQIPNVSDYASNWLERSLHIGLISKEHYDKNQSIQKITTEDPQPPSPEFQALSPPPTSHLDFPATPINDEASSASMSSRPVHTIVYSVQWSWQFSYTTATTSTTTTNI